MNLIKITVLVYICVSSISMLFASSPLTKNYQSHNEIISIVSDFIKTNINDNNADTIVSVKPLDNRLRLSLCEVPLTAFWPPGARESGHTSVGVRCDDSKPWKIFVGAQIKEFAEVWVMKLPVVRGTILNDSHIKIDKKEVSHSHSKYFTRQQSPVGLLTKRPLRAGDIIQIQSLEKPMAVQRGDRVIVIARKNGLEIRATATALNAAAQGDRIRVRNLSTKKEMEGTLDKNSIVYVNI